MKKYWISRYKSVIKIAFNIRPEIHVHKSNLDMFILYISFRLVSYSWGIDSQVSLSHMLRWRKVTACLTWVMVTRILRSSSYSLKDIGKCSTIRCDYIPPSELLKDDNFNNTYVSRDAQASCRLVPHFVLYKHIHAFAISNPKYHCYMNSVIQLLFLIIRTIRDNFQSNSRKVHYHNVYLKQHIVHTVLLMWMH